MFASACKLIEPCLCQIFGVKPDDEIVVMGAGCLLAPNLVISARHLFTDAVKAGGELRISNRAGTYSADLVWKDPVLDVAVFRTTASLSKTDQTTPTSFPKLATVLPEQGMLVGYMATLRREGGPVRNNKYFSSGFVSHLSHLNSPAVNYVLGAGFMEGGFSGGPVFQSDGSLIGVLVCAFQIASQGLDTITFCAFPEFASVAQIRNKIAAACQS